MDKILATLPDYTNVPTDVDLYNENIDVFEAVKSSTTGIRMLGTHPRRKTEDNILVILPKVSSEYLYCMVNIINTKLKLDYWLPAVYADVRTPSLPKFVQPSSILYTYKVLHVYDIGMKPDYDGEIPFFESTFLPIVTSKLPNGNTYNGTASVFIHLNWKVSEVEKALLALLNETKQNLEKLLELYGKDIEEYKLENSKKAEEARIKTDAENAKRVSDFFSNVTPNESGDDNGGENKLRYNVNWSPSASGIAGLDGIMTRIVRELFLPYISDREDITRPRGMILYGPPGNGKTLIAKAACEFLNSPAPPVIINGPEINSKWYGETEGNLRAALTPPNNPEYDGWPHIVIIDEMDSIIRRRGERSCGTTSRIEGALVATMLTALDGMQSSKRPIIVIGTTNMPDQIDPAITRPGRLSLKIEIPLPDYDARVQILEHHLSKYTNDLTPGDIKAIALKTEGASGAFLAGIVKGAGNDALTEKLNITVTGNKFSIDHEMMNEKISIERRHLVPYLAQFMEDNGDRNRCVYIFNKPRNIPSIYNRRPHIENVENVISEINGRHDVNALHNIVRDIHNQRYGSTTIVSGNSRIFLSFCEERGYIIIR